MEARSLTEKDFWEKYWLHFKTFDVEKNIPFERILNLFPKGNKSFIEVGGFPGTFSIYFKKNFNYEITLLDYLVKPEVVHAMEVANGLSKKTVKILEADFLDFVSQIKYDVVFSWGFIEHFKDTALILKKHANLLQMDGTMIVGLPNFLGLNGLVQKLFDPKNLSTHYLPSMEFKNLENILAGLNLTNCRVFYCGRPCLWLETTAMLNPFIRLGVKVISKLISFLPFSGKLWSPYIVIYATK